MPSRCSVVPCADKVRCKGYCTMHYRRWLRHGDPLVSLHERKKTFGGVEHGTPQGYNHHGCRCEICTGWRTRYNRDRRMAAYGMTVEDFEVMHTRQGGVCAICKQPPTATGVGSGHSMDLRVDHDHVTGKVRALLCHHCNVAIGHLRDDPVLVLAAADYLLAHQGVSA